METFMGDEIRILVSTETTLTGATVLRVKYRKPDGSTGAWTSTITVGAPTYMEYTTGGDDLDQEGIWQMQAYAVIGGKTCNGRIVDVEVQRPISLEGEFSTAAPTTAVPTTAP